MLVSDLNTELAWNTSGIDTVYDRAAGAYLGLAVGDALGATVEFMTPREIREVHGEHRNLIGGGWLKLRKGRVTDDTEMSLALGNAILAAGGIDAGAIAEAFSDWMRTKPVDIGHTVRRGICQYRLNGTLEVPESEHDAGNGACMRCLPIALFTLGAAEEAVAEANRIQSHVTHHSRLADAGTLTVIRMVQLALVGRPKSDLHLLADDLVAAEPQYRFDRRRMENPGGYLVETLRAVFQALFATDSFETALVDVVNRGGDADTTGAILGMIAGALYGPGAIPRRWLGVLEKDTATACVDQASALVKASSRNNAKGPVQGERHPSASDDKNRSIL
jgi:ADP-ribosyl-[dinitrogen reductase] hydrolase